MSTTINALTSTSATPPPEVAKSAKDPLTEKVTFLRLLVSQLQNQNPLDPVDGNQFLSQLTSYSQLEQLIGIHQDTTALNQPTPPPTPQPPAGTTPATSGAK